MDHTKIVDEQSCSDFESENGVVLSTATFSKTGNLMPDNTPVIEITDVVSNFNEIKDMDMKALVPYVVYLPDTFADTVKRKKRSELSFLIFKSLMLVTGIFLLIYFVTKGISFLRAGRSK